MRKLILVMTVFALVVLTFQRFPKQPFSLPDEKLTLPRLTSIIPKKNILDPETGALYFYHAHREGEEGHFHIFIKKENVYHHLIAIGFIDGAPSQLFTTDQWLTGENRLSATETIQLLDAFTFSNSDPTSCYLQELIQTLKPQISALLKSRDEQLTRSRFGRFEIITRLNLH